MELHAVHGPADLDLARTLLREYQADIGVDLCFQGFEAELVTLPGEYTPPQGGLWLIRREGLAGCVALRPLHGDACEMKRLYVRRAFRRHGLGRSAVLALFSEAKALGHRRMRLDTLPSMNAAIDLYRSLGFRTIDPYRENPIPGALFFERAL